MKKLVLAISTLCISVTAVLAADDPIATRKRIMDSTAAAAGLSAALMKGDIEYNPTIAKAAILTLGASAATFGDYFPEGSGEGQTTASPKIWEDADGFKTALAKFTTDTSAALQASGKDGPADLDAFKAAMVPVMGNCRSCHEAFRVQN